MLIYIYFMFSFKNITDVLVLLYSLMKKNKCPRFTYNNLNTVIPCSIGDNGDVYVFRVDFFPPILK